MEKRIGIKTERKTDDRVYRPVPMLIFLLMGVYGLLLFLQEADGVFFDRLLVYPACSVMCALAWYLYYGRRKWFFAYVVFMTAAVCFAAYYFRGILLAEAESVAGSYMGLAEEAEPATWLVLVLSWFLVLLLFFLQIVIKKHSLLYLILTALMLAGPLLGVWTGFWEILLLLAFQAAFFVAHKTGSARKGRLLAVPERERLAGRSSSFMVLILLAVLIVSAPVAVLYAEKLYQSVYTAEGFLSRAVRSLSDTENDPVKDRRIGRGNNYQTGTERLVVRSTKKPVQTLYLKGFTGGLYVGGEWQPAEDEPLLEHAAQAMGWQRWLRTIEGMYSNMYYVMNSNMWMKNMPKAGMLTIRHQNGDYRYSYEPYYSQRINENAYSLYGLPEYGYGYWFYEQGEMNVRWDAPMGEFDTQKTWYSQLREEYKKGAETAYTLTPAGILPRLTSLCRENPQDSLEDITAFILYTLHSNAEYSLTPGWASLNEDVVENFLFERKSGYCIHFASAATLMYRTYGVPARYAAGYVLQPGDFVLQADGAYCASATDREAHAWVEIFLDEYGWTPVEVTPSAGGETVASFPGFDGDVLRRRMKEKGWDMDVPSLKESGTVRQRQGGRTFQWSMDERIRRILPFLADLFLYGLCFLPLYFHFRRKKELERLERMGSQAIFGRLVELLHFGGLLSGCDGLEEDFAERLAGEVPAISGEHACRVVAYALKAAYGKEENTEERECLISAYQYAAEAVYGGLGIAGRLIFRYVRVFR